MHIFVFFSLFPPLDNLMERINLSGLVVCLYVGHGADEDDFLAKFDVV